MSWLGGKSAEGVQENPEQQAARWLSRQALGLMRREEETAFAQWREVAGHEAALASVERALEQAGAAASSPGIAAMRTAALNYTPRHVRSRGWMITGIAATFVLALVPILLWMTNGDESVAPVQAVYETHRGERRTVNLDDGSVLELNTDSRAQVSMSGAQRSVRLLKGQALFDVAHDAHRPFTVTAGELKVQALGTRFDVRLEGEQARVVLLEGRVAVEPQALRGLSRLVPALDRHYLKPGQQLVARDERIAVGAADVEKSTDWRQGRLIFRGEPLARAVAEINRYGEHQLAIADEALAQLPVSGVFSVDHPENFLAAVLTFYPIAIEERSENLSVLSLRGK